MWFAQDHSAAEAEMAMDFLHLLKQADHAIGSFHSNVFLNAGAMEHSPS
jgi:hypothetical protein